MAVILWIITSYLLGSVPFGFIFSRLSGKDALKVGWKKTSGSNVFRNVGKLQGVLTGLFDVGKGFLAVLGAQKIGFGIELQMAAGTAAVIGHNWSVFLKFSGGRGIGTLIGALAAASLNAALFAVGVLIIFAIIFDAAIGTIVFLALFALFYFFPPSFLPEKAAEAGGLLSFYCLFPVFLKRLSPIRDIARRPDRVSLAVKRLIFDCDEWGKPRAKKAIRFVSNTVVFSSKTGWKATKYGTHLAKKPFGKGKDLVVGMKKKIMKEEEIVVTELKPEDFKKMLIASAKNVVLHQEEINRINVFPVADQDTGYNLAATLIGIEGTVANKQYSSLEDLAKDIKSAAMVNARGNAGLIFTGYFAEVLDRIKHLEFIDAFHLAFALRSGIKASRMSVAEPVEGTILDAVKAAGKRSYEVAKKEKEKNIIKVLEEAFLASQNALKETTEKLQVLKDNDVVDAGALGFVKVLEGWIQSLKGITPSLEIEGAPSSSFLKMKQKLENKFEVVGSFDDPGSEKIKNLKEELLLLGDSLEIIKAEKKVKLHIHTSNPDKVISVIREFSGLDYRTENMQEQIDEEKKKPLGLVVDAIADIPKDFLKKYDIEEIQFTTRFPDTGEIISSDSDVDIYSKMEKAVREKRPLPTTSAPSFQDFFSAYVRALKKFEKILVITATSKLSATYSSARIARSFFQKPEKLDIFVFDSRTAEIAEGLLGIKAQELISQGYGPEEIMKKLKKISPETALIFCIDDYRYLSHGGRFKVPPFLLAPLFLIQKMGIRIIVGLVRSRVRILGIRFGGSINKVLEKELEKMRKGKEVAAAIAHAGNPEGAEDLRKRLEKRKKVKVMFTSPVSPIVGSHTGPGGILLAFRPVEEE